MRATHNPLEYFELFDHYRRKKLQLNVSNDWNENIEPNMMMCFDFINMYNSSCCSSSSSSSSGSVITTQFINSIIHKRTRTFVYYSEIWMFEIGFPCGLYFHLPVSIILSVFRAILEASSVTISTIHLLPF